MNNSAKSHLFLILASRFKPLFSRVGSAKRRHHGASRQKGQGETARLRLPGPLLLPLSARCMLVLLRLWMGIHSLPGVLGRRSGPALVSDVCHMAATCTGGSRCFLIRLSRRPQQCCAEAPTAFKQMPLEDNSLCLCLRRKVRDDVTESLPHLFRPSTNAGTLASPLMM